MSISAVQWALEIEGLTPGEKLVLIVLANAYREGIGCWPSTATIARQACITRRSVFRAISSLEARGLVHRSARVRGNGAATSNGYVLACDKGMSYGGDVTIIRSQACDMKSGQHMTSCPTNEPEVLNRNNISPLRGETRARACARESAERRGEMKGSSRDDTRQLPLLGAGKAGGQSAKRRGRQKQTTKWRESDRVPAEWIREEAEAHEISEGAVRSMARAFEAYWAESGKGKRNWRLTFRRWVANDVARLHLNGRIDKIKARQKPEPSLLEGVSEIGGKPMTKERRRLYEIWRRQQETGSFSPHDGFDEAYCPTEVERTKRGSA